MTLMRFHLFLSSFFVYSSSLKSTAMDELLPLSFSPFFFYFFHFNFQLLTSTFVHTNKSQCCIPKKEKRNL
ncbi:hypothetical protein Lalb_Chr11g0061891 [Lupinus albus]|uniref:Secreted protein n=1 Tax=Lupinus albus TaxID=3870 RepID=A0A6A4PPX2_LUPAL|nr:hypothetical protein Lalb_Chr11g0061891 [Lupinus albus]